ncbi:MAG: aminotransferase class V-fold PLP-dependent enzyme [Ilumatobacter sp.]
MTPTAAAGDVFAPRAGVYLLSHSIGLPTRGAEGSVGHHLDVWHHDTANAWPQWLDTIAGFRSSVASLVGGDAASVCPQSTVSSGLVKLLDGLRSTFRSPRPTILLTEEAFPSLGFVCQRSGYDVRYIEHSENTLDPMVWDRHLKDVDVAVITHVHSNTGVLTPAADIIDVAHRHSAITVVDVAQSAGVIDIDTDDWNADFLVGSCVKWLSGGPGAGWLWARPNLIDRCQPADVGWFSHDDPFEFDIHHFRYADDALRFWGGTPTVLPFAIARESINAIRSLGLGAIREHNLALTSQLVERLGDRVTSPHREQHRSGTAIVRAQADAVELLAASNIHVDHRQGGLRVSPHLHTSHDDIDLLTDLVRTTPY